MAEWDDSDIIKFTVEKSGERSERAIEGPALLGPFAVWRSWIFDGHESHAH